MKMYLALLPLLLVSQLSFARCDKEFNAARKAKLVLLSCVETWARYPFKVTTVTPTDCTPLLTVYTQEVQTLNTCRNPIPTPTPTPTTAKIKK